jgi:hypothetical protein
MPNDTDDLLPKEDNNLQVRVKDILASGAGGR